MRLAAMLMAVALSAQVRVPRPAPELVIAGPAAHEVRLSSLRGRVVLLAFVLTTCGHCQEASKGFEHLRDQFGSRGFEVVEAAINDNADSATYTRQLNLRFPVGVTQRANALRFLGIRGDQRIGLPQVVLIDRTGMVRAQSAPEGSPMLQSEDVLRGLIERLLSQGRR